MPAPSGGALDEAASPPYHLATPMPTSLDLRSPRPDTLELFLDGRRLGVRREALVRTPDAATHRFPLQVEGLRLTAALGPFGVLEEVIEPHGGLHRGRLTLRVHTDAPFLVALPVEQPKPAAPPYFLVPGFLYGTNNDSGTTGTQARLRYGAPLGDPASGVVSTRADRSTHPGVLRVEGGAVLLVGLDEKLDGALIETSDIWAPRFFYNGLFIDTTAPATESFGLTLGYEHVPRRHGWVWETPRVPGPDEYRSGHLAGLAGRTLTTHTYYAAAPATDARDAMRLVRTYYDAIHVPPRPRTSRTFALSALGDALVQHGYNREHHYFHLADDKDGRTVGDIAWTGGMQAAWPLLVAARRTANASWRATALDFAGNLCARAFNERAGLFLEEHRDGAWQVTGWWGVRKDCLNLGERPLHSAYANGQAACYLLKAFELEGRTHRAWLQRASSVVETAVRSQDPGGAFAFLYHPTSGLGVDFDGFQGAWMAAAAATLGRITNDQRILDSARRGLEWYNAFHRRGELFGTPMDARKSVDEEGNLAFLTAAVEMHRATSDPRFLDMALDALHYEFSWKFAYDTAHTNDPLRRLGWQSTGGSITSTYLPMIHPMGNIVAGETHHVWRETEDPHLASRLRDTCVFGLGIFNREDGEFGFGLRGQATEQFFNSDALICPWNRPWDGGVWEASLPWAAASVLLSAAEEIPDRFFDA